MKGARNTYHRNTSSLPFSCCRKCAQKPQEGPPPPRLLDMLLLDMIQYTRQVLRSGRYPPFSLITSMKIYAILCHTMHHSHEWLCASFTNGLEVLSVCRVSVFWWRRVTKRFHGGHCLPQKPKRPWLPQGAYRGYRGTERQGCDGVGYRGTEKTNAATGG